MTSPNDPIRPGGSERRRSSNRAIITIVLGVFVVAVFAVIFWGSVETSQIEGVPDEASMPAPGEGSVESGATGATAPPAPLTTDPPALNNPVITE